MPRLIRTMESPPPLVADALTAMIDRYAQTILDLPLVVETTKTTNVGSTAASSERNNASDDKNNNAVQNHALYLDRCINWMLKRITSMESSHIVVRSLEKCRCRSRLLLSKLAVSLVFVNRSVTGSTASTKSISSTRHKESSSSSSREQQLSHNHDTSSKSWIDIIMIEQNGKQRLRQEVDHLFNELQGDEANCWKNIFGVNTSATTTSTNQVNDFRRRSASSATLSALDMKTEKEHVLQAINDLTSSSVAQFQTVVQRTLKRMNDYFLTPASSWIDMNENFVNDFFNPQDTSSKSEIPRQRHAQQHHEMRTPGSLQRRGKRQKISSQQRDSSIDHQERSTSPPLDSGHEQKVTTSSQVGSNNNNNDFAQENEHHEFSANNYDDEETTGDTYQSQLLLLTQPQHQDDFAAGKGTASTTFASHFASNTNSEGKIDLDETVDYQDRDTHTDSDDNEEEESASSQQQPPPSEDSNSSSWAKELVDAAGDLSQAERQEEGTSNMNNDAVEEDIGQSLQQQQQQLKQNPSRKKQSNDVSSAIAIAARTGVGDERSFNDDADIEKRVKFKSTSEVVPFSKVLGAAHTCREDEEEEEGISSIQPKRLNLQEATRALARERKQQEQSSIGSRRAGDPLQRAERIADEAIPERRVGKRTTTTTKVGDAGTTAVKAAATDQSITEHEKHVNESTAKENADATSKNVAPPPRHRFQIRSRPNTRQKRTKIDFDDSDDDDVQDDSDDESDFDGGGGRRRRIQLSELPNRNGDGSTYSASALLMQSSSSSLSRGASRHGGDGIIRKQRRRRFTDEEKQAIREGVQTYGVGHWADIKAHYMMALRHRTSVQIKDCYRTMCQKNEI